MATSLPAPRLLGYASRAAVLAGLIAAALHASSGPASDGGPLRTEAAVSFRQPDAGYQIRLPIAWRVVERGDAVWVVPPGSRAPFAATAREGETLVERPRTFFVRVTRFAESCTRCHNPFLRRYGWARDAGADVVTGTTAFDGRQALAADVAYPPAPQHGLSSCDCVEVSYWCPGCTTAAWGIHWSDDWYLLVEVVAPEEDSLAAYRATGMQVAVTIEPFVAIGANRPR